MKLHDNVNTLMLGALLAFSSSLASAQTLSQVVQYALENYPSILEARSTKDSALTEIEKARALHWPTLGAAASSKDASFNPGSSSTSAVGRMNVFAGGGIEARVKRETFGAKSADFKIAETSEEVAFQVAQAYLDAIRALDQLEVGRRNLARHEKFVSDLKKIVSFDMGRRSDFLQAQARKLQVQSQLVQLEGNLESAKSRLAKYYPLPLNNIKPIDLSLLTFTEADIETHPTMQSQLAEQAKVEADLSVARADRLPRVDVEAVGGKVSSSRAVLNWNFFDKTTMAGEQSAAQKLAAAQARSEDVRRSLAERARTAKVEAEQAQLRIASASNQVQAAQDVAQAYDLQFHIARRSLIDVLNAYSELSNIEASVAAASNDLRAARIKSKYAAGQLVVWAYGSEQVAQATNASAEKKAVMPATSAPAPVAAAAPDVPAALSSESVAFASVAAPSPASEPVSAVVASVPAAVVAPEPVQLAQAPVGPVVVRVPDEPEPDAPPPTVSPVNTVQIEAQPTSALMAKVEARNKKEQGKTPSSLLQKFSPPGSAVSSMPDLAPAVAAVPVAPVPTIAAPEAVAVASVAPATPVAAVVASAQADQSALVAAPATDAPKAAPAGKQDVRSQAQKVVDQWRQARQNVDMREYFSLYNPNFKGAKPSRALWERERTEIMSQEKNPEIELSGLEIEPVSPNRVRVYVTQVFRNSKFESTGKKSFELERVASSGAWLIAGEGFKRNSYKPLQ